MNKFDLINKVLVSDLQAEDKCLLIELIVRADDEWKSWPSVERLCMVRGIKHEKNFKGADHYLPGLVTKTKRGRKNVYTINTPALAGLSDASVAIKHTAPKSNTPAQEGVYTPATADNTPSTAGANSTSNTTRDTTQQPVAAIASPASPNVYKNRVPASSNSKKADAVGTKALQHRDTPSTAGVSKTKRFLSSPEKKSFESAARSVRATPEQKAQALEQLQTTRWTGDIYEAATRALSASGAVVQVGEAW